MEVTLRAPPGLIARGDARALEAMSSARVSAFEMAVATSCVNSAMRDSVSIASGSGCTDATTITPHRRPVGHDWTAGGRANSELTQELREGSGRIRVAVDARRSLGTKDARDDVLPLDFQAGADGDVDVGQAPGRDDRSCSVSLIAQ